MSRRKRQPEEFDVVEFLRESDADLKSAINTLLRSPQAEPTPPKLDPGVKLGPEPLLNAPVLSEAPPALGAGPILNDTHAPKPDKPVILTPGPILSPGPELPRKRRFPIREMQIPRDAHTRAEQQLYERLWEMGAPSDDGSRAITIGFGAMAKLVGLSESNARINMRSLIAKLAVEGVTEYNCAQSLGRTYRILPPEEIMKRRREAGLLWYMRRTLAVVFVNPATGEPLHHKRPAQRSLNNLQS
jgi:hypothetical protein